MSPPVAPSAKPFNEWLVTEIARPGFDAAKAIADIMAVAPEADRRFVLAANFSVLSSLFATDQARAFIQAAAFAELGAR